MDEVVGAVEQLLGVERLGVSFVARAVEIGVLQPVAADVLALAPAPLAAAPQPSRRLLRQSKSLSKELSDFLQFDSKSSGSTSAPSSSSGGGTVGEQSISATNVSQNLQVRAGEMGGGWDQTRRCWWWLARSRVGAPALRPTPTAAPCCRRSLSCHQAPTLCRCTTRRWT